MNTPPTNGTKTQSKFHLVASNNPKGSGLFSCTPKNETLRNNKEDEAERKDIYNPAKMICKGTVRDADIDANLR